MDDHTMAGNPSSPLMQIGVPVSWLAVVLVYAVRPAPAQPPIDVTAGDRGQEARSRLTMIESQPGQPSMLRPADFSLLSSAKVRV